MSNSWFSGKQASNLQQWFATIGQTGQILSAVPFAFLLHETSWEQAFLTAAAITALVGALVWLFSRENPAIVRDRSVQLKDVVARLKRNSRKPITWLAFFTHFTTQSTGTSFALLWGVPFMVSALSLPLATAGSMLTLFVITNMSMGPVIGWFCGRWPQFRHVLIFSIIGSIILVWSLVLLNPNPTPFWMLIVLVMTIGVGGPASMVAFDYSKEAFVPSELGATNGLINVGGFLAALVMMWIVGVALDALPGPVLYSFEHFRIAFALQLVVTLFGLLGLVWSLRAQRNKRPRVLV
jgi:sugar phosphate permease